MNLLREVDFKQTRDNARNVLKNFRRLERIAGRSLIDIKSPVITDMPKVPSHGNKAEDAMIQLADAEANSSVQVPVYTNSNLLQKDCLLTN